jgi:putative hydrolase
MHPEAVLRRIAYVMERRDGASRRSRAFRNAAETVAQVPEGQLRELAQQGQLESLPGVGRSTAQVIQQALVGDVPARLAELEHEFGKHSRDSAAQVLRRSLLGDCHTHSEWSDGTTSIAEMVTSAIELGHRYIVLTDHSPRLQVANGLSAARLEQQLEEVSRLNEELAPFRILTGIETDILPDGRLDQRPDLLARLDVVVASVHSKLRMESSEMTQRMLAAIENPNMDILGHCTGRMRKSGGGRPESEFDPNAVFEACARFNKAVEINCRPERLDPPRRLLAVARDAGCLFSIDSDAHAPGELEWLDVGCERAAACDVAPERIVNTWDIESLLKWTASHAAVETLR